MLFLLSYIDAALHTIPKAAPMPIRSMAAAVGTICVFDGLEYGSPIMEPTIAQRSPFVQKVEPGTYWWCACGQSKGQPFCDGSHKGTGFGPQKVEIAEARTVAWCGCKHTKNGAFCDGSHSRLA
jgi:CDGSH-type Zn-finger protein